MALLRKILSTSSSNRSGVVVVCTLSIGMISLLSLLYSIPSTGQDLPPLVEISAPDSYEAGLAFELSAYCIGCVPSTPKKWVWTIPKGCAAVRPSTTSRLLVKCTEGGPHFTFTATPQGVKDASGGSITGTAFVVVGTSAAGLLSLPTCDGAQPQPVQVPISSTGVYYRPGLASTGRLNMVTLGNQVIRVVPQCVEGGKP